MIMTSLENQDKVWNSQRNQSELARDKPICECTPHMPQVFSLRTAFWLHSCTADWKDHSVLQIIARKLERLKSLPLFQSQHHCKGRCLNANQCYTNPTFQHTGASMAVLHGRMDRSFCFAKSQQGNCHTHVLCVKTNT